MPQRLWEKIDRGLLSVRGMPTGSDPAASGNHNGWVIELQSEDGGPTGRRFSLNASAIPTPGEMVLPGLLARMKQRNPLTSEGVKGIGLIRLKLIARATSQTNIFKSCRSLTRQRQNVVEREGNAAIECLSQTIRATSAVVLLNLGFEVNRNVSRHAQLGMRNRMPAPAQQGRCLSFAEHKAVGLSAKLN